VHRAAGLAWPPGQTWATTEPVDHTPAYGLPDGGLAPALQLDPLRSEATINGEVTCRIGRDLYLATPRGTLLVDTGLLEGWALTRANDDAPLTADASPATTTREPGRGTDHDVLF